MNQSINIPESSSSAILINPADVPIVKCDPEADETPYCTLCLRARPPGGAEFYEYTAGSNASEFRQTMQSIVGLELNMEGGFAICTPCWKLIQLMVDFRLCCLKAQDWAGRYGSRGIKGSDEWFDEEVGQAIDSLRTTIREHVEQIEEDEAFLEDQDQAEAITAEEDHSVSYEQVDQIDEHEGVVTQISVGDFKIEVFDDVDQDIAEPTEQTRCENCDRCFSSKEDLEFHIQICKQQEKTNDSQSTAAGVQFCTLCNAMLANKRTLRSHMNSVHGPKKHQCEHCPSKFARAYDLKKHSWALHSGDRTKKPFSPQLFQVQPATQSSDPKLKENVQELKIFSCKICARVFSRDSELLRHHRIAHSTDPESPSSRSSPTQVINNDDPRPLHKCPTCAKEFRRYPTLKQHAQRWHAHLFQGFANNVNL